MNTELQPAHAPSELPEKLRLHYLDGIRGLAALMVVMNHAQLQSNWHGGTTLAQRIQFNMLEVFSNGRTAVAVFIVLSGYSLMIPVARSAEGSLRGGTLQYLRRRAIRILPPYYAALFIILILESLVPELSSNQIPQWQTALPFFTHGAILSHLLLVHNWNSHWLFKIDPPAWTVATEWQIYFVFPLVLLPLWKRYGNTIAILIAFFVGFLPIILFHHGLGASPWFLGLFAMGMGAASINFSHDLQLRLKYRSLTWIGSAVSLLVLAVVIENLDLLPAFNHLTKGSHYWFVPYFWVVDTINGAATACFLVYATNAVNENDKSTKSWLLRFLELPLLVLIGSFSYSLYLIHDPILAYICVEFSKLGLKNQELFGVLVVSGLPTCIFLSYLFHHAFERRFIGGLSKS